MECFECGSVENLHNHHVVPRSLGGIKTVPLCNYCHGKIHGIDFSNHGILIKKALDKKKKNGEKLGRPLGKAEREEILAKYPDIQLMLLDKMSIRKIAKLSGHGGSTVQRVKKLMAETDLAV